MSTRLFTVPVVMGDLNRVAERIVRQIVVNSVATLREVTPRDTSWARANWVPNIGAPRTDPLGSYPGRGGHAGPQLQEQDTLATRVLLQYRLNMGAVYISNNVPYIGRLNEGSSGQAPAGFVQSAIARVIQDTIRQFGGRDISRG